MSLSLIDQLPLICREGRKEAEYILNSLNSDCIRFSEHINLENQLQNNGNENVYHKNRIFCSDNIAVLQTLLAGNQDNNIPSYKEKIDLIYIDPPYDSKADYKAKISLPAVNKDEKALSFEHFAYSDNWQDGTASYLKMLYPRLYLMKELLKNPGSIYIHVDWHASHYVKIIMDDIFGKENFRNEIIWHYRTYQGHVKEYFPRKHDTILFYVKGNPQFQLLKDNNYENNIDFKRWNKYLVNENEIRGNNYPKTDSRFNCFIRKWERENPGKAIDENAVLYRLEGYTVDSVWDIKAVDPKDNDRLGYPTQKPNELLERIIKSSTIEGSIIADFFAGSGTTAEVAEKLGRKWIMSDISSLSSLIMKKRMLSRTHSSFTCHSYELPAKKSEELININYNLTANSDNTFKLVLKLGEYNISHLNSLNLETTVKKRIQELLKQNPNSLIEYWSVDPDYDENTFNTCWIDYKGSNPEKLQMIETQAMLVIPKPKENQKIAVKISDIFGFEYLSVTNIYQIDAARSKNSLTFSTETTASAG